MNTEAPVKSSSGFKLSDKAKRVIVDLICYLYVLLFLYAATSKLLDYENSELQMSRSPIISDYAFFLVWFVPAIEILISILLIVPRTILLGLYLSAALMCAFTIYIIAILNFSKTIPCSCGGVLSSLTWSQHLIFNIVFIFLGFATILLKEKTLKYDN
jgi:uncharacterized membrane protein YphA (DoxX/SURF4 family)